jgi:hypothetical protein
MAASLVKPRLRKQYSTIGAVIKHIYDILRSTAEFPWPQAQHVRIIDAKSTFTKHLASLLWNTEDLFRLDNEPYGKELDRKAPIAKDTQGRSRIQRGLADQYRPGRSPTRRSSADHHRSRWPRRSSADHHRSRSPQRSSTDHHRSRWPRRSSAGRLQPQHHTRRSRSPSNQHAVVAEDALPTQMERRHRSRSPSNQHAVVAEDARMDPPQSTEHHKFLNRRLRLLSTACPFENKGWIKITADGCTLYFHKGQNAFRASALHSFVYGELYRKMIPQWLQELESIMKPSFKLPVGGKDYHSKFTCYMSFSANNNLVISLAEAERWCRSRNCQAITDYVKDVLDTASGKGKVLASASCPCPIRRSLTLSQASYRHYFAHLKRHQVYICWTCGEVDCESRAEPRTDHVGRSRDSTT